MARGRTHGFGLRTIRKRKRNLIKRECLDDSDCDFSFRVLDGVISEKDESFDDVDDGDVGGGFVCPHLGNGGVANEGFGTIRGNCGRDGLVWGKKGRRSRPRKDILIGDGFGGSSHEIEISRVLSGINGHGDVNNDDVAGDYNHAMVDDGGGGGDDDDDDDGDDYDVNCVDDCGDDDEDDDGVDVVGADHDVNCLDDGDDGDVGGGGDGDGDGDGGDSDDDYVDDDGDDGDDDFVLEKERRGIRRIRKKSQGSITMRRRGRRGRKRKERQKIGNDMCERDRRCEVEQVCISSDDDDYDDEFALGNQSVPKKTRTRYSNKGRRRLGCAEVEDSGSLDLEEEERDLVIDDEENSNNDSVLNYINSRTCSRGSLIMGGCRKMGRRRRKKSSEDLDPDYLDSGSLDLERAVSEHESENAKETVENEGSVTCASSSLCSRRSQGISFCWNRRMVDKKGQEEVGELHSDTVVKQVCGICLSEEQKSVACGMLDSCSHYFCFPCIMEWSKVESKCPVCKQRFTTISRPARLGGGKNFRKAVIRVPVRDQVYQPSEEEVWGYHFPYENAVCVECLEGGDEDVMLLCDICDTPSHTYCVGLGFDIPEGNWYCGVCRPSTQNS